MARIAKNVAWVVTRGRKPGIFHTWKECEAQVTGFSGCYQRGFETLAAAEELWKNHLSCEGTRHSKDDNNTTQVRPALQDISGRFPIDNYQQVLTVIGRFSHRKIEIEATA